MGRTTKLMAHSRNQTKQVKNASAAPHLLWCRLLRRWHHHGLWLRCSPGGNIHISCLRHLLCSGRRWYYLRISAWHLNRRTFPLNRSWLHPKRHAWICLPPCVATLTLVLPSVCFLVQFLLGFPCPTCSSSARSHRWPHIVFASRSDGRHVSSVLDVLTA